MSNLTHDPITILIRSDAWGTRLILDCCAKITRDQFHKKYDMGLGTLHVTLTHIISVMRRWTDRLAGRTPRPMLHTVPEFPHLGGETKERTPAELRTLLDEAENDLLEVARQCKDTLHTTVTVEWPGDDGKVKVHTFTRGAVFVHLTTHGYHHRSQCLNMLRHLGVPGVSDSLPEPSAVDWQGEIESPPVVKA
jgi:uncharacterized damage-inducible protein DinB